MPSEKDVVANKNENNKVSKFEFQLYVFTDIFVLVSKT